MHEALNIPAFEQAWQKVIERHSILRTRFQWEGLEQPQQMVHKQVECSLKIQDWRDLSSKTQEKQLADYLQKDRKQGFSLTEAPVMRFTLFQLSEDNYQFIWTSHHTLRRLDFSHCTRPIEIMPIPMRKRTTGEPCARESTVRREGSFTSLPL